MGRHRHRDLQDASRDRDILLSADDGTSTAYDDQELSESTHLMTATFG
jgi:hypothetical protein